MRRLGLVLLAATLLSGCLRSSTTITVKQDGSGTLDQEIGATPQALAMLRSMGAAGGDKAADVQMFGPEQAAAAAKSMGVRFVSGEPIKTADSEGYRAHFAFDDVTQIKFEALKGPATPGAEASGTPPFGFAFAKGASSSVLTITMPDQKAGAGGLLPQMPGGGAGTDNQQAMAMILPMLRGLFVDVTLNVEGRVIKTNAPYVSGSQVTLLQFDFDKVSASEGGLQKLQTLTDPKLLKDIPGVRMVTDPVVTIEFGR